MKKWIEPEYKLFGVKLNENIAASVSTREKIYALRGYDNNGNPTFEYVASFIVNGTYIQGTEISYQVAIDGKKWVSRDNFNSLSGCRG